MNNVYNGRSVYSNDETLSIKDWFILFFGLSIIFGIGFLVWKSFPDFLTFLSKPINTLKGHILK